jgi:Protein of unknown function (DUF1569)
MKTFLQGADVEEIHGRIGRLTDTDARMSCHQMVCHLTDAFGCPLGERAVAPLEGRRLPSVYKRLALYVPMKWPKGVVTPPEMDQRIGGTRPVEFSEDCEALLRKLDQFVAGEGPWVEHPMFGAMTTEDWMRWGYLHTDHHLRQFGR